MFSEQQISRRKDMPKAAKIAEYWAPRLSKIRDSPFDAYSMQFGGIDRAGFFGVPTCFACGKGANLDRAHIKALGKRGSNKSENLHLLCRGCHAESESLDGQAYWNWFLSTEWRPAGVWGMERAARILGFDSSAEAAQAYAKKYGDRAFEKVSEHLRDFMVL